MVSYSASKVLEIKKGKQIRERSIKELVGSVFKKFMDSDRYKTTVKRSQHIFVFKIIFDFPWQVSANHTDVLKILICGQ